MDERQIVRDLFLPADQQPPGTIEPRMSTFNFPTTSFATPVRRLRSFIGLAWNVRLIAALANLAVHGFTSISLVEAKILRLGRRRFRTLDGNTVECLLHQFLVRHIGAGYGDGQRHAAAIDQRRAFDAEFATIGRVFPGFFPHPAAT